jgi:hypothetical protein
VLKTNLKNLYFGVRHMEAIREQLKKPWAIPAIAFVVGLFIGLVVLGWWLWPVQWTDASVKNLRSDLQTEYLRMAIDAYSANHDPVAAKRHFDDVGPSALALMAEIEKQPGSLSPQAIADFGALVVKAVPAGGTAQATSAVPGATAVPGGLTPVPTTTPAPPRSLLSTLLTVMCVITVLLAVALVGAFLLRNRLKSGPAAPAAAPEGAPAPAEEWTSPGGGEAPPMAQFSASYKLGDDLFDDSFSVDSPSGEFLGECGVGISETIGVGEPKKVTAFEVWLFDKNDIQTVTKVVMSAHAFTDEAIRQRLAAKGEPVQAAPGIQVVLETATLQLVARVVDMGYGDGAMPTDSYFESLILDLAVWQK